MNANNITIIGMGLIGGSFALDIKRARPACRISTIDPNPANRRTALAHGMADQVHATVSPQALHGTDFVLIAAPVSALEGICSDLAAALPAQTVVCDTGSTKQNALAAFRRHLPQHYPRCVAAHPIAGAEQSGAAAARHGLFAGRRLILCPHEAQDAGSLKTAATLWRETGAAVSEMDAAEHDRLLAAVSHLPHLLAFAYIRQMLDAPDGAHALPFAGSGFRDFTRIAASSPEMWTGIALANRQSLLPLLEENRRQIEALHQMLRNTDENALHEYFQTASSLRAEWGKAA